MPVINDNSAPILNDNLDLKCLYLLSVDPKVLARPEQLINDEIFSEKI